MKKFLLATTLLGATTGFAVADVSVSGSARMGVVSSDSDVSFSSRVRMMFSGSGTTDAGLAFGGSFEAKDAQDAEAGTSGSVFLSGAFGKIAMGDVDSGDEATVGQIAGGVGYTGLGSLNSINYAADGGFPELDFANTYDYTYARSGGDAKVLYTYATGGLTFAASSAQLPNAENGNRTGYGVGAAYTTGALTIAAGYGTSDVALDLSALSGPSNLDGSVKDMSASVAYVMGATTIKAIYQDKELDVSNGSEDGSASAVSAGLSLEHRIDALSLTAYGISTKFDASLYPDESVTTNRYGIGATYDLGGGAKLAAGWAHNESVGLNGSTIDSIDVEEFDAGVNFSF